MPVRGRTAAWIKTLNLTRGPPRWRGTASTGTQILALGGSGLLIATAESGEVALLRANPSRFEELGRFRALGGKTWNHPVVVGDRLFVRNAEEMACFALAPASEVSGAGTTSLGE